MRSSTSRTRLLDVFHVARTFARSVAVGLVATAADLTTLALMIDAMGARPVVANVPALLVGTAVQFVGNKRWAFGDRSVTTLAQGIWFGVVAGVTLFLNAFGFHLLVARVGVHYLVARLLADAVVYVAFTFPLWHLIFRGERVSAPHGSDRKALAQP